MASVGSLIAVNCLSKMKFLDHHNLGSNTSGFLLACNVAHFGGIEMFATLESSSFEFPATTLDPHKVHHLNSPAGD